MTIKKSLITTDWRAKGLKGNPGTRSFRICLLLLIMLMVPVAVVSAAYISSISPTTGSYIGGDQISIVGEGFVAGNTYINFTIGANWTDADAVKLTNVTYASSNLITAITPAYGTPGTKVNMFMKGANTASLMNAFTYQGDQPPTIWGFNNSVEMFYASIDGTTGVNISGTWLGGATSATFGGTSNGTIPFVANDGFNITMKAPAHAETGLVTVSVNTLNGSASYRNLTYVGVPVITSVSPAYGSTFGGETITIIGSGDLSGATKVYFNLTEGTSLTKVNSTAVTVKTPVMTNVNGATFVNITTAGGRSANSLFTYINPPNINPPTTSSNAISPQNGSYLGGTQVTITGTNFTAASAVKFNGTAAQSFTVNTAGTQIIAVAPAYATNVSAYMNWQYNPIVNALNIPVNVTTYTGVASGTTTNNYGNFTYDIYKPNISSTWSGSGSTGGGNTVTITGTNLSYAKVVYFGNNPNSTAGPVTVVSDTQITCIAPSSLVATYVTVNVTTPGGVTVDADGLNKYQYTQGTPTFTSISPAFGPDTGGQWVNITGTNLIAASAVSFGGAAGSSLKVFNDTSITVKTPVVIAQTVNLVITVPGNAVTAPNAYTFQGLPHITGISPAYGGTLGGNTVTITGTNLTGASFVRFNVTPATGITVVSPTTITAVVPPANGTYALRANVNVSTFVTDDMITKSYSSTIDNVAYQYNSAGSFITISPVYGPISGGTFVSFGGTNLNNATQVTFDGTPATNMTTDLTNGRWMTANAPAHAAGPVAVLIQTPAGIVSNSSNTFTYLGNPSNILVTPAAGPIAGNTPVTITGLSFTGATVATFGATPANNFVLVNDTTITATTPSNVAGPVSVVISAIGGTGTGTFTYQADPTVTSLSTTTGSVLGGTPVTITGTGFIGATSVKFGTTAATFTYVSPTSITTTSPAGTAGVVNVTVTTLSGTSQTSTASQFTYTTTPTNTATVGVFRNGAVYLAGTNTNGGAPVNAFSYGMTGDVPVTGKWTNTATANTIGIFRGSNGMFYLRNSNDNGVANTKFNFGQANDVPVSGHWSGAGSDTVGVFRTGTFFLAGSNVNGGGTVNAFNYGMSTDVPVAGDWFGTGTTNVGIFRNGLWALASSNAPGGGTPTYYTFGQAGDVPVTGDWNADGKTEVGVFRNGMIYQATSTGTLSNYFYYGMTSDLPVGGYFG